MSSPNYWTLQITYGGTADPHVEERKDLNCGDMKERDWIRTIRERLYTAGFEVQTSPTTWEFISPYRIHTALLIKQDRKYTP